MLIILSGYPSGVWTNYLSPILCPACINSISSTSITSLKLILKEEHNILLWTSTNSYTLIQPTSTISLWTACYQQLLLTDSKILASQGIMTPTNLQHHLLPFWIHAVATTPKQTHSAIHKARDIINQLNYNPNAFLKHQNATTTNQLLLQSLSSAFMARFKLELHIVETLSALQAALHIGTGVIVYLNSCPEVSESYTCVVSSSFRKTAQFTQV